MYYLPQAALISQEDVLVEVEDYQFSSLLAMPASITNSVIPESVCNFTLMTNRF